MKLLFGTGTILVIAWLLVNRATHDQDNRPAWRHFPLIAGVLLLLMAVGVVVRVNLS